ncbi:MAG: pyridoxal phosphate-dependent aminotransferase [Proteobacteria bacterium]|nr:pyridoxal phosphate-dependent aminotransferase [Pseudomonadota bacterium]
MFEARFSQTATRLLAPDNRVWAVHDRAMKRLAAGEDIIVMSVGDPDLPTIAGAIALAVTSLYRGRTHYSPGMGEPELRRVIAEIESDASGRLTTPEEIIIFPGATNALFTVLACLLDKDDELIVTEPAYIGYRGLFAAVGAAVVAVPSLAGDGFRIDIDAIKAAATDRTRVLLLNTPGNPSGHVIPHRDLQALCEWALEQDIWLVCDEVYSMLTFETPFVSARKAAPVLDNIIIVDGLSKSHAMTGWRLGWVVAPLAAIPPLLEFTSATVFGCSQFVQDAAAFALKNDQTYIQSVRDEYRQRRDYALARIAAIRGITCVKPAAGMFMMMDVSETGMNGYDFAENLLDRAGVSVLPGGGFGSRTTGFVRLSLTQGEQVLKQAFDRIETFCLEVC